MGRVSLCYSTIVCAEKTPDRRGERDWLGGDGAGTGGAVGNMGRSWPVFAAEVLRDAK